jgi:hypothetical protein
MWPTFSRRIPIKAEGEGKLTKKSMQWLLALSVLVQSIDGEVKRTSSFVGPRVQGAREVGRGSHKAEGRERSGLMKASSVYYLPLFLLLAD